MKQKPKKIKKKQKWFRETCLDWDLGSGLTIPVSPIKKLEDLISLGKLSKDQSQVK